MKMCLHLYTKMLKLLERFYQLFNLLINVTTLGDIFCYKGYKSREFWCSSRVCMVLSEQLCYVNWHLLWMVALPRLPSWSRKHISQSCTDSSYQSSVFSFVIWLVISRLSLLVLAKCHYLNIVFLFFFLVSTIKERKKKFKTSPQIYH